MTDPTPRHFSMLREFTPADLLTLGNAACGTVTLFLCLIHLEQGGRASLTAAFVLLPLAFVLDALDGWVARTTRRASRLGGDLDSLADIISFGVAPAVLAFALGARGTWDAVALVYFVLCGVSRLARFNVTAADLADESTGKVRYFEGTPIPTSLVLVGVLGVASALGHTHEELLWGAWTLGPWVLHPITLLFVASGSAMISATLRIPKP